VKKIVAERALLDQPYLVDQSKTVAEAIKEAIAACGEKISVRRFTRYVLGEGIEKKSTDLAADVAAMAAGKA
jgi:elongation factor Ts